MIAAAIEQEDDLAAVVERLAHRADKHPAQAAGRHAGLGLLVAEVDQSDLGHRPVGDTARQREPGVAARGGVLPGFEGRRRGAEEDGDAEQLRRFTATSRAW